MNCPKCQAGLSRLRLVAATHEIDGRRKASFRCMSCESGFTKWGSGMDFNAQIMSASTNTRRAWRYRNLVCPLILAVNRPGGLK